MDIHLGSIVKEDAVLVEDIDLSLGIDLAVDVRGIERSHHLAEDGPIARIVTPGALVEVDHGLGADIEVFPVDVGILRRLLDIDLECIFGRGNGGSTPRSGQGRAVGGESVAGMEPVQRKSIG